MSRQYMSELIASHVTKGKNSLIETNVACPSFEALYPPYLCV